MWHEDNCSLARDLSNTLVEDFLVVPRVEVMNTPVPGWAAIEAEAPGWRHKASSSELSLSGSISM